MEKINIFITLYGKNIKSRCSTLLLWKTCSIISGVAIEGTEGAATPDRQV